MTQPVTRITVTLLNALLAAIEDAVRPAFERSRSAFVAKTVRQALASIENAEIDAALVAMATDAEYQREALRIAAELEQASWETLQLPAP